LILYPNWVTGLAAFRSTLKNLGRNTLDIITDPPLFWISLHKESFEYEVDRLDERVLAYYEQKTRVKQLVRLATGSLLIFYAGDTHYLSSRECDVIIIIIIICPFHAFCGQQAGISQPLHTCRCRHSLLGCPPPLTVGVSPPPSLIKFPSLPN
jgi:hypothetical protein